MQASNHDRLQQIAHYVIARAPTDQLGATKLNKVLWYIDCWSWWQNGESLTGLKSYTRMKHGPVPKQLPNKLSTMKKDGSIIERRVDTPVGVRREFVSLIEPDLSGLSAGDIDMIHKVIAYLCKMSAKDASEITHDAYWEEIPEGGEMSIAAGSVQIADPEEEDLAWAMAEARALGLHA